MPKDRTRVLCSMHKRPFGFFHLCNLHKTDPPYILGVVQFAQPQTARPGYNSPRNEIFKSEKFHFLPLPLSPKFDFFTNSIYNIIKVKLYI